MMLTTLLTPFLLMGQAPVAPASSLSGIVYDQQRATIPRAELRITCGADRRVLTAGEYGRFAATALPGGPCTIVAAAPLFEPETVRLTLSGDADVAIVLRVRAVETEVTVSAHRGVLQEAVEVPRAISTTTRADIESRPYQLLPQVLREEPGILVQQTTTAQASPIIRGFTGQSNVYLVDGVRLNTSAWRTGPSQYFAWLDPDVVERLEIVRGPGSVQYGSDALGGTVNVLTSVPSFSAAGLRVGGSVDAMLGSADSSRGGAANLAVQAPRFAFRLGLGTRDVNDLRAGRGRDSHAAVTRFLGLPSGTIGSRLEDTGFRQSGGFVTGSIRAGSQATVNTVFVHQDQTGASRYDRIGGGDGLYRSGFDPQTLDFLSLRYRRQATAGFDDVSGTASVNRQSDGRFEQTRPTAVLDAQRAVTTSYGYQVDAQRRIGLRQRFSLGAEIYDESIGASREQTDPRTGASQPLRPDIPDGTGYTTVGVFAQDAFELIPDRLTLLGGIRYGRFVFSTASTPALGVTAERVSTDTVTFDAGAVLRLASGLHFTFAANRGFRAANAADLGAVGLTGGGGFEIAPSTAAGLGGEVGSTSATGAVSMGRAVPPLGPEVAYTYEPGLKFQNGRLSASIAAFDIEYLEAIQRRAVVFPSSIVGTVISGFMVVRRDTTGLAYIAEDQRPIGTRVNVDRARIRGVDLDGTYRFSPQWRARTYYSMSNGRLSTGEFIRRMPPPLGAASLRWSAADDRRWLEGVVAFAGAQRLLNPGDLSDDRIGGLRTRAAIANYFNGTATDLGLVAGGVLVATGETLAAVQNRVLGTAASAPLYTSQPGFVTLGLRAAWRFSPGVDAVVIGENLTDRNYRLLGSGVDAPGANLQLRLRYGF
jgi:outer membrane receptor protein involved in Fe transport